MSESVCAYTGNGVLYSYTNKGVLDSLGITQLGNFTTDNEYRLYIDNVRIVAVPEPACPLAYGLVTFGLLGYSRLRQRRI